MDLEFYARYYLEHKALPNALYNEGPRLLNSFMLDGGKAMHGFYDRVTAANPSYCCPYSENDFYANYRVYIRDNDSCMVLRVQMPTPEYALLCRAVYLCYGTRVAMNYMSLQNAWKMEAIAFAAGMSVDNTTIGGMRLQIPMLKWIWRLICFGGL